MLRAPRTVAAADAGALRLALHLPLLRCALTLPAPDEAGEAFVEQAVGIAVDHSSVTIGGCMYRPTLDALMKRDTPSRYSPRPSWM